MTIYFTQTHYPTHETAKSSQNERILKSWEKKKKKLESFTIYLVKSTLKSLVLALVTVTELVTCTVEGETIFKQFFIYLNENKSSH